ncbi:DUF2206 domain-containing protein [uncultured Methanobacterium sp.]|uniref:DUF2206 domain-containing protein n=1 Tax=uncultured Methanobacterium sp. TaxID=176306 RepID=UPI0037479CE2
MKKITFCGRPIEVRIDNNSDLKIIGFGMISIKSLGENKPLKISKQFYFLFILLFVLITDLTILINIPALRQSMGFISLNFIPGLLILHIMKINRIGFLKKIVFSVGLSISFLMLAGLLINSFYPVISRPLSLTVLLICLNIIFVILLIFAYLRTENNVLHITPNLNLEDNYLFIPLLSLIFPLMAIIGMFLMNSYSNNILLMVMLLSIPLYLILIAYFKNKTPKFTYPLAIIMISLSLVLMHGLRSSYVTLSDSSIEIYVLKLTLSNLHWDPSLFKQNYNSSIALSILPSIYYIILGIKEFYIYKIVYNLLFVLTPLCGYLIFRKYCNEYFAFLAAFFLFSQHIFISMYGWIGYRQIIASIFFALTILTLFENKIRKINTTIILILFIVSMILANYSTAYIFFMIIALYWIVSSIIEWQYKISAGKNKKWIPKFFRNLICKLPTVKNYNDDIKIFTGTFIALIFILMFLWYSQINATPFDDSINFMKTNLINILNMAFEGLKSEEQVVVFGKQIGDVLSYIIYYVSFATIGLGVYSLLRKNKIFNKDYFLMIIISFVIAGFLFVSSVFIVGFGVGRVYQELLVFLAPCFVIGAMVLANFLSKFYNKINWNWIVILLIIAQFFSSTYMIYQLSGDPHSEFLNSQGTRYESWMIQDKDYIGAKWLFQNNNQGLIVKSDYPGQYLYGEFDMTRTIFVDQSLNMSSGFIFLRTANTQKGHMYLNYEEYNDISVYKKLFKNKSRIYSNGGSEIYN